MTSVVHTLASKARLLNQEKEATHLFTRPSGVHWTVSGKPECLAISVMENKVRYYRFAAPSLEPLSCVWELDQGNWVAGSVMPTKVNWGTLCSTDSEIITSAHRSGHL